jgi:hypothetical protein
MQVYRYKLEGPVVITYPLFVFDGLDVMIFNSEQSMAAYLEEQDVAASIYRAYDANGYCVRLRVDHLNAQYRIYAIPGKPCVGEFAVALRSTLAAIGTSFCEDKDIDMLKSLAVERFDVY